LKHIFFNKFLKLIYFTSHGFTIAREERARRLFKNELRSISRLQSATLAGSLQSYQMNSTSQFKIYNFILKFLFLKSKLIFFEDCVFIGIPIRKKNISSTAFKAKNCNESKSYICKELPELFA
jgi:hypothetical protein